MEKSRRANRVGLKAAWTLAMAIAFSGSVVHGAAHASHAHSAATAIDQSATYRLAGWFSNYGNYMPRIHCLQRADGTPDWPWIGMLIALNVGVIVGYTKIFRFWRRNYLAEAVQDRNRKLMDLAHIFLWCAVCGYGLAIVMFWWPAYRLNAVALAVLNFFTWRFAHNLGGLGVSLSAVRLQRELRETLENRAADLELIVAQRTAELEQARAAAELARTQAIAADEAKTNFLANMSHEIRTPMTAILGFTQILAERQVDDAARRRYTQIVRQNGQHLLNVINDVLDMTRIEAGQIAMERLECDLPSLLHDVEQLWTPKAAEKGLTLALRVEAGVPIRVRTDPTRLKQVLFNLVGNAIKFTEQGGITIVARPDETTLDDHGPARTLIEVVDTGIGMDPAQRERLFERFMQADTTTTRRFGGSGLGLVIAKHLTTLLGGTIGVNSLPGEGSRFTVAILFEPCDDARTTTPSGPLPEPLAPPSDDEAIPPPAGPLAGVHVLVADDQEDNRGLVRFILECVGAIVEFATDGREAVDAVRAAPGRFGVVLMDMHMPRLDGYAATTTLRHEGQSLPIIAVTANSLAGDRDRCLAAGCDDYVTKPIDGDALVATIAHVLARGPISAGLEVDADAVPSPVNSGLAGTQSGNPLSENNPMA